MMNEKSAPSPSPSKSKSLSAKKIASVIAASAKKPSSKTIFNNATMIQRFLKMKLILTKNNLSFDIMKHLDKIWHCEFRKKNR